MQKNCWRLYPGLIMSIYFKSFLRYSFLILLALACFSFFYFDLYSYLSFQTLRKYQEIAQAWTTTHYSLAVSIYILVFTLLVASAIPCATLLTLLGGFLFDVAAIIYAECCITIGGTILFLAVRAAIGTKLVNKSTGWLKKIEAGFNKNAFNYLLTLRLIPIFPCWISNIGAGLLNVSFKTFVTATALGILPSTVIYVYAGRSLETILKEDKTHIMHIILTPTVLLPLLGLAIFSLLPVIYNYVKRN